MKITKELLKQLIKEEIAALNEEESAIKDAKEFVARLEQHGQSRGGFKNDKIRKKFIELAIEAAKESSKSSGGVFPMYPRLFNDIVSTIEKGNESKIYKQSAAPASKTKTSVTDCRISGLRRVKTEIENNIAIVTVEKDGKQAIGSHPVRGGLRDLARGVAEDKAREAWIKKHGCPE
jgi:hypothetical protein